MSEDLTASANERLRVEKEFRTRLADMISRRLRAFRADPEGGESVTQAGFTEDLTTRLGRYFPECGDELHEITQSFKPDLETDHDFSNSLSRSISRLLLAKFTPREVDDRLKEVIVRERGWKFLTELVSYEIKKGDVVLHVSPTFSRSILEAAAQLQRGLVDLAAALQTDPALRDIRSVSGASWIVLRHKNALENAGWTVRNEDPESGEAMAEMSREKFIQTYGEK